MPGSWDAVVVGAGVIGCAVGRELSRRGLRTVIIDSRRAGGGATQASAGVLAPYIEAPGGGPLHRLAVRSLDLFDGFIAELESDVCARIEYRRCGTLEVAADPAAAARLESLEAWARAAGVDAHWLTNAETLDLEPALRPCAGSLLVPRHGYVRAAELTAALLEAAARAGAAFLPAAPVDRVECDSNGARVSVGGDSHHASTVVIAAGSWSSRLGPDRTDVRPIRGQLLRLSWKGPRITRVLWGDRCYVVPWTDGTLLVGATVEDVGFDERTTVEGVRELLEAASELLGDAGNATFLEARAGLRPATSDHLPIIGRSAHHPSIVYATGHYRNGILLTPLTAQLIGDLVVDGKVDPDLTVTAVTRTSESAERTNHGETG